MFVSGLEFLVFPLLLLVHIDVWSSRKRDIRNRRHVKNTVPQRPKNNRRVANVGLVRQHDLEDRDVLEHGG